MIRGSFLSEEDRNKLIALARWVGRLSRDLSRELLMLLDKGRAFSGSRRCGLLERRYEPWLVQTLWTTWDRRLDQFRPVRERASF